MIFYSNEIQEFINKNKQADLDKLLLKKSPFPNVKMAEIVKQIKGKIVAEKKFPKFAQKDIVYPPSLNLEQTSSESTALYKSKLLTGQSFLDLSCGFGVDAFYISKKFKEITLVEPNQELLELVKHNWAIWNQNAHFICQNAQDFLEANSQKYDVVYLDPARRNILQKKVFLLEDLSPNILEILPKIQEITSTILIKLSPLIDINYLLTKIKKISEIHIVAVKNEVKEILILINKNIQFTPKIAAINLETSQETIFYDLNEEKNIKVNYCEPKKFIYIPNNSILKAGAFDYIAKKYSLGKLHPNTHIYTSDEKIQQFPGRILEVEKIHSKSIQKGQKYNIISKNHPLKPDEIIKKYQLKDGGEKYLIFTQTTKEKIILQSK